MQLAPGALPQLQGALRRLRFAAKPTIAVVNRTVPTTAPAASSTAPAQGPAPPTPLPMQSASQPAPPSPAPPKPVAPASSSHDRFRERNTTWAMPRVLRTLPDGVTVNVPVGVKKYVGRYNGIKRLLRLLSKTGEIRHIGDPQPLSLGELRSFIKKGGNATKHLFLRC